MTSSHNMHALDQLAGRRPLLDGKVAIVTGGASGIGKASVELFVLAGAVVHVIDLATVPASPDGMASWTSLDISDEAAVMAAVAAIAASHGRIEVLFNCAGVGTLSPTKVPLHQTELATWQRTFAINADGTFLMTKAVLPYMVSSGCGSIVNVASVYALAPGVNSPSYVASKNAVIGMTRSVAIDYGAFGIRANVICPGFVETEMLQRVLLMKDDPVRARAEYDAKHPLGRIARPEEIAAAAAWLASDAASFVTGVVLPVDGGYTIP